MRYDGTVIISVPKLIWKFVQKLQKIYCKYFIYYVLFIFIYYTYICSTFKDFNNTHDKKEPCVNLHFVE